MTPARTQAPTTTFRGDFAADLLQMQQIKIPDAIFDCCFRPLPSDASEMASPRKRRASAGRPGVAMTQFVVVIARSGAPKQSRHETCFAHR